MTGQCVGNNPSLCCLPGAWDRATVHDIMGHGEPLPAVVADTAAATGVDPHTLDWHVEAVHGWEPHDPRYGDHVRAAAECLLAGGCE